MIKDFDEELIKKMNEMKADLLKNKESFIGNDLRTNEKNAKLYDAIKVVSQKSKSCPYCGVLLFESEKICTNCGKRV